MRFTLLYAGSALAVSLVFTACSSSSNSQAIPGSSQSTMASTRHGGSGHLVPTGFRKNQNNYLGYCPGFSGPSPYLNNYCYFITAGTSFSQGWCESQVNNCSYPTSGNWYWRSCHTYRVSNGRGYRPIRCSWGANPSNPNTQSVAVGSDVAPTSPSGPPVYYVTIKACSNNSPYGPGYCDGPYEIGLMIEPSSR